MPRLSEWAGGRVSGRVADDVVSMGCVYVCMCVCVCVYVCVCVCICVNYACSNRQTHSEGRTKRSDGGTEGWMDGWMDCVGKRGRHLRFNLVVSSLSGRRGGVGSLRTERSLEIQGCRQFGGCQKLVGYQTEGVRGHVCVPCE